jgi:hypothetical protein
VRACLRCLAKTWCVADSDYRGNIRVVVESRDPKTLTLEVGKSWFQLVPIVIHTGDLNRVDHVVVDDTARGTGGFGSTGNKGDTAPAVAASAVAAAASTTCDNVVMEVGEAAKPATQRLE